MIPQATPPRGKRKVGKALRERHESLILPAIAAGFNHHEVALTTGIPVDQVRAICRRASVVLTIEAKRRSLNRASGKYALDIEAKQRYFPSGQAGDGAPLYSGVRHD